jgi:predicted ATPase/class 3 adenylate cyclase/DNA-binding CsgD family transcriptional regulator
MTVAMEDSDLVGLPTGTVTLLMADVEDSTRLWELHGDDMAAAVESLDALVNEAIARHGGERPLEQGEGDSFVVAFTRTSDAVACAVDIQRGTRDLIARVRIGVHTGEVQTREPGLYTGLTMNRTARIRNAGNGGQILLSQTAADLVADHLDAIGGGIGGGDGADEVRLVDLGVHALRGLERPERLWSLVFDDHTTAATARPLRPLGVISSKLPAQLTPFVGRARELDDLAKLLHDARAVTLTGAGGCGKTRLAVEVASQPNVAARFAGGAWFVDLSAVNEVEAVVPAIGEVVGAGSGGRGALAAIERRIGDHHLLLVVDNCEHLVDEAARVAEQLLRACPNLTIVATSREPLSIDGEITYRVPSLAIDDATALFAERARRARPQFALDDRNAGEVEDICRRLEGIPLAIELAAARLRTLSPAQVRDGLQDRFRLLTGGARTAVARQQTLQASVDWSYMLLLDVERTVLNRLSVFAGGFTIDAATRVCGGRGVEDHHVPEIVLQLVDKSLVLPLTDDDWPRYTMLETVRQYAASRLADDGDADDVRRAHFDHCLEIAKYAPAAGVDDITYRRAIDADYDNIRRALQWADAATDSSLLGRLTSRLYLYWSTGARQNDGARWFERALERETDERRRVNGLSRLAVLLFAVGRPDESDRAARDAIDAARALGDQRTLLWSLLYQARGLGWDEDGTLLEEAIALAESLADREALAFAFFQRGFAMIRRDPLRAMPDLRRALEVDNEARAEWVVRMVKCLLVFERIVVHGEIVTAIDPLREVIDELMDAGEGTLLPSAMAAYAALLASSGDRLRAVALRAEIEAYFTDESTMHAASRAFAAKGFISGSLGDAERALSELEEARRLAVGAPDLSACLSIVATTEALNGRCDDATRHALESRSVFEHTADRDFLWAFTQDYPLGLAAFGRGEIDAAEAYAHEALVRVHDRPSATFCRIGVVLLVANVRLATGRGDEAVRMFAACAALADRAGVDLECGPWIAFGEAERAALAESVDDFDRLWNEGYAMSWDDAVAYAQRGRGRRGGRAVSGWDALTPTERQVCELVAAGLTNKEVSDRLFMSVATVKSHLTHAYAKLGVSTRTQLATLSRSS